MPTKQRQSTTSDPKQPVAPQKSPNASDSSSQSQSSNLAVESEQPSTSGGKPSLNPDVPGANSDEDDKALNLNLDLEEFIPEDKNVDFDQYAEQIKETAQKGAKENLKQQVENASKPSDIDLEGLKEDLTKEIRDTAGDIAPPDKQGIGQDRDRDESDDAEADEDEVESDGETSKQNQIDERGSSDEPDQDETERDKPNQEEKSEVNPDSEEDILDSSISRPSPPTSAESARRYDETTDSLYVQKNACRRVITDVKEVQNTFDLFRERIDRMDTEQEPADEAKNIMSDVQRKLLDLENNLFEEDTL